MKLVKRNYIAAGKNTPVKFSVDCSIPVKDSILFASEIVDYLTSHFKVDGKLGNFGEKVKIETDSKRVTITSTQSFSKRYIKYLLKRYLKKNSLRDFLRVIATNQGGQNAYKLLYYPLGEQVAEDDYAGEAAK